METFYNYNGYGIRYRTIGGTTTVESMGYILKSFKGFGCIDGEVKAKSYIDNLTN